MIPQEISIAGVYFPPLLLAVIVGAALASFTARYMNRMRWSRFFFYPPVVYLAFVIIYTGLVRVVGIPY